jgi:hypothetical protein
LSGRGKLCAPRYNVEDILCIGLYLSQKYVVGVVVVVIVAISCTLAYVVK